MDTHTSRIPLNGTKGYNSIMKWEKMFKVSKKIFFPRKYATNQKAHEKMFNIINHQGNVIKTTVRLYLISARMHCNLMTDNKNVMENVKKLELSCTVGGNTKQYSQLGKQFDSSSKV